MPVSLRRRAVAGLIIVATLTALAGCGYSFAPDGALLGEWGGLHLELTADPTGARLQYDCATGVIDPPVMVAGGQLHATGTHSPGHGGPIREDEMPVKLPARYDGELTEGGNTLALTVTLSDTGERLGVYKLTKGRHGQVFACL